MSESWEDLEPLDLLQADQAARLGKIERSDIDRAIALLRKWKEEKRSTDLAEAVAEISNLIPEDIEAIRDRAKKELLDEKIRRELQSHLYEDSKIGIPTLLSGRSGGPLIRPLGMPDVLLVLVTLIIAGSLGMRYISEEATPEEAPPKSPSPIETSPSPPPLPVAVGDNKVHLDKSSSHRYAFTKREVCRYVFRMQFSKTEGSNHEPQRVGEFLLTTQQTDLQTCTQQIQILKLSPSPPHFNTQKALLWFTKNPRGELLRIYLPPETPESTQSLLIDLVLSLRIVLPPSNEERWKHREQDRWGTHEYSYRQSPPVLGETGMSLGIEKDRRRLLDPSPLNIPGPSPEKSPENVNWKARIDSLAGRLLDVREVRSFSSSKRDLEITLQEQWRIPSDQIPASQALTKKLQACHLVEIAPPTSPPGKR
jgi:hypothetical protein